MRTTPLTLVPPAADTPAARAAALQAQVRAAEQDTYKGFLQTADDLIAQARQVAGMESLPNGVRDEARRMIPDLEVKVRRMTSLRDRA